MSSLLLTQKDYLDKKKYKNIESLLYSFKVRRREDKVCNLYYELIRNQQDLDSLLFVLSNWGGKNRVNPMYLGFGTITSRITLRQPALQNLRKSHRDVIVPDEGMKLLYIDYSQFEAGILASLSNDETMIELYNTDIYSDIGEKLLNNKEDRQEAKILFYRFMYGDESLSKAVKEYFSKFNNLETFRKEIKKEAYTNHEIGTENGNFRISKNPDEDSWVLSHKIQALASLVYKTALIKVYEDVADAQFLIPMHDGTVYQLKNSTFDDSKTKIEQIYKDTFKSFCPKITPKITTKDTFT